MYIKFRIVLNSHKSIVLHCINTQIINISKLFYADSNGGIFVVLRCVNPELCCGKVIERIRSKYQPSVSIVLNICKVMQITNIKSELCINHK